jgi:hypothetical protein
MSNDVKIGHEKLAAQIGCIKILLVTSITTEDEDVAQEEYQLSTVGRITLGIELIGETWGFQLIPDSTSVLLKLHKGVFPEDCELNNLSIIPLC